LFCFWKWDKETRREVRALFLFGFICVYFGMNLYCLIHHEGVLGVEENATFTEYINIFQHSCITFDCFENPENCTNQTKGYDDGSKGIGDSFKDFQPIFNETGIN
jgi:hypothetical protein